MGNDEILCRYVLEFERGQILAEAHGAGCRRTLCRMRHSTKDSSCKTLVANPTSRLKSILLGLRRMSTDWETIVEGRNAAQATDDAATVLKMGDQLCGAYHTSRKDRYALYHHHDRLLDTMGRSTTG